MIEGSLSRRYTRALFQLAQEGHQEEQIGREIERFFSVYDGSALQTVLNNPAFRLDSRKKILSEVTNNLQLSPVAAHFLWLLLERGRLTYLPSIVACYRRFLNEVKGRVEAKAIGASPLEAAMVERLRQVLRRISGKEVILHEESDSELIGGLVIEMEGKVYDGSVRTQLERMRQRIARGY